MFSFSSDWTDCLISYESLNCNYSSYWNDSIEIQNNTNTRIQENITVIQNEIENLTESKNRTKNQTLIQIKEICMKIKTIKNDINSLKVIKEKFLQFCLKNRTINDNFVSKNLQNLLENLMETSSPEEMNETIEEMSIKQKRIHRNVTKLLRKLKANLLEEIKRLRAEIKQQKKEFIDYLAKMKEEIEEKNGEILKLETKISLNTKNINEMLKKLQDCKKGKEIYEECSAKRDSNQNFLTNLKEEKQLILHLLDLMEKLT